MLGLPLALLSCDAVGESGSEGALAATVPVWTQQQIGQLRQAVMAAGAEALPVLPIHDLDAAMAGADHAAMDAAADALALRLAGIILLGAAPVVERSAWRITDSDSADDLPGALRDALAADKLGGFFEGLHPQHPDYAALRSAYAAEFDPVRRRTIARNMERWRWMPRSLGRDYVLVNSATFDARLWRAGQPVGTWRVIVGKAETPSPVFQATITGVTFNPWWDIPASIVKEKGGRFPARLGYVRTGSRWRQKPGPANALGQMKLVMPNPYNVYLHDTPSRSLFQNEVRAYSHGCIRVGDAVGFASTLLEGVRSRPEIDAIIAGGKTVSVTLPVQFPVYITYFTAGLRGDGSLAIVPDIYGRDGALHVAGAGQVGQGPACPA